MNSSSVTLILVVLNVIATLYAWNNPAIMQKWILNPYQVWHRRQLYRVITSGFIHANWMHLIFNMIALYSFGEVVEYYFGSLFTGMGSVYFILMYVLALVVSDLSTLYKYRDIPNYNSLGASGAVSAVVFSSIIFDPWAQIYLWFIPVPGIILGVLFIAYSYMGGRRVLGDNINHEAHLFGALFGFIFTFLLEPNLILYFFEMLKQPRLF